MASFQRPRTVSEGVYEHLRQELLNGRLEPNQWLREQELAAALNVSRTPVREAVRQLAQEGLLTIEPNRGVRVVELSAEEAVATYEVRQRLEAMAAGLAAHNITDSSREELGRYLQGMQETAADASSEQIRADNEFHAFIASLAGNPVLSELIEKLNDRVIRVKILTRDINSSELARNQHREIAAAISAGDEERAEGAMSEHIHTNLGIVRKRLEQALTASTP